MGVSSPRIHKARTAVEELAFKAIRAEAIVLPACRARNSTRYKYAYPVSM